jgi:PA domain-containing protein
MKKHIAFFVFATLLLASVNAFAGATITIVNKNAPGVGFNDPTAAAPVGGNAGTTLGQQRLNAFQFAAGVWGAKLDSKVEIKIFATFEPLACTATAATLGSAGARFIEADFPNAQVAGTWYHDALANKQAGVDQTPPELVAPDGGEDIRARFNSNLGSPTCLAGTFWYLGFDNNHGGNIDLVTVLEHEFAHGLGFSTFIDKGTGAEAGGLPDIYEHYIADDVAGSWLTLGNAGRSSSVVNNGHVIWTGSHVDAAVPSVLSFGTPNLNVTSAGAAFGKYAVGTAAFGSALSSAGITGTIVAALDPADAAGPTTFDACSPLTNAGAVAGNIALVTRGTCGFIVKVKNAQNAGAIAVVVADNAAGAPPAGLGGADPTITIPSVRVTLPDGNLIRANLPVTATLGLDLTVRAGANPAGRALLYAPLPMVPGSSTSHWDTSAFRNQLMEPAINTDLTHSVDVPEDMTLPLLRDIGWYPDADLDLVADDGADSCLGSDLSASVVIGSNNSGVPNTLFTNGCSIKDFVNQCLANATSRGSFNSCVAHLGDSLLAAGIIDGAQKDALQSAAARSKLPK